jgi:hypothetical protein
LSSATATRLAWSLWAACVVMALTGIGLDVGGVVPHAFGDALLGVALLGCASVGALLSARRPENPVGWVLLAIAVVAIGGSLIDAYANSGRPQGGGFDDAMLVLSGNIDFLWIFLVGIALPVIFPTGSPPSPRWRLVIWAGAVGVAMLTVGQLLQPGPLDISHGHFSNPIGISGAKTATSVVIAIGTVIGVACFAGAILAVRRRLQVAHGNERVQVKWFAYFLWLILIGLIVAAIEAPIHNPPAWAEAIGGLGWFLMLSALAFGLPLAAAIAILRHRLYDIDVVINRTLVYGALTATLAVTYAGSVLLLELVLRPLTAQSALAIAASTLAVAAAFRPLRARIQNLVDRRFYRHKYDAERTLEGFTSRLREEVDLDALRVELGAVVLETMQPQHVSLWLRERRE